MIQFTGLMNADRVPGFDAVAVFMPTQCRDVIERSVVANGLSAELSRLAKARDSFKTSRAYRNYAVSVLASLTYYGLISSWSAKRRPSGKRGLDIQIVVPIRATRILRA